MKRLLKFSAIFGIALVLAVLVLLGFWRLQPESEGRSPGEERAYAPTQYLRAVHWFGDAWPINFWNTDLESRAEKDFRQIAEDGFNTVVLVIPWPGFAPNPESGQLSEARKERLLTLMRTARELGLKIVLRVSYAWDATDHEAGRRLRGLWLNDEYLHGWLEHLESLWHLVENEPNFQFAFFSWEDLWAIFSFADADFGTRLKAARDSGFQSWLSTSYAITEVTEHYRQPFSNWSEVPLPQRDEPAFQLLLEFVDYSWIHRFFVPAKQRFPRLSMEIRIDSDGIYDGETLVEWYGHHSAWKLPDAEWVTLYWTPSMGGQNIGEILSPESAAERLDWWMRQVEEHTGGKKIFIGQFLAEDFTPGYERNGRIARDQVPEFLSLASEVLASRTHGYGLWAWSDYGHDVIASPQFFNGLHSWQHAPGVTLLDNGIGLAPESWIRQRVSRHEYHAPGGPDKSEICVTASPRENSSAVLQVRDALADIRLGTLRFDGPSRKQCLIVEVQDTMDVHLKAVDDILIERVTSIGFVQRSGMRDIDKKAKPVAAAYRMLNESLKQQQMNLQPLWPDQWMGAEARIAFEIAVGENELLLQTFIPEQWPVQPDIEVWINGRLEARVPCQSGAEYRFDLTGEPLYKPVMVRLISSQTHRVPGDERELGCIIKELAPVAGTAVEPERGRTLSISPLRPDPGVRPDAVPARSASGLG